MLPGTKAGGILRELRGPAHPARSLPVADVELYTTLSDCGPPFKGVRQPTMVGPGLRSSRAAATRVAVESGPRKGCWRGDVRCTVVAAGATRVPDQRRVSVARKPDRSVPFGTLITGPVSERALPGEARFPVMPPSVPKTSVFGTPHVEQAATSLRCTGTLSLAGERCAGTASGRRREKRRG